MNEQDKGRKAENHRIGEQFEVPDSPGEKKQKGNTQRNSQHQQRPGGQSENQMERTGQPETEAQREQQGIERMLSKLKYRTIHYDIDT